MDKHERIRDGGDSKEHTTGGNSPAELFRKILFPGAKFNENKFQDHRRFTAFVLCMLAIFLPLLWGWDYFTDPVGARNTIGLRLAYLLFFPLALGFWARAVHYRFLEIALPVTVLLSEAVFVEILNRLDTGMVHGIAGFMYAMFIVILAGQGLSLIIGISFTLAAAALPQLMAIVGFANDFPQWRYAILIWPAAGLTIVAQVALAESYLQRHRLETQLKALSDTDALSGVANRRCFMRVFKQEITRAQRLRQNLSLLALDIDHFKRINDVHGHPTGDIVIRQVADICSRGLRTIDVLGRIGGEEFAIFLIGASVDDAAEIAERLRGLVESATAQSTSNIAVKFTVSIGVTQLSPDDMHGTDLFERADAALYAAKAAGRNKVICG